MKDIIAQNGGIIAAALALMLSLNSVLGGVQKVLSFLMPSADKQAASKAYKYVGMGMVLLQKGIDLIQGNIKH